MEGASSYSNLALSGLILPRIDQVDLVHEL